MKRHTRLNKRLSDSARRCLQPSSFRDLNSFHFDDNSSTQASLCFRREHITNWKEGEISMDSEKETTYQGVTDSERGRKGRRIEKNREEQDQQKIGGIKLVAQQKELE